MIILIVITNVLQIMDAIIHIVDYLKGKKKKTS